MTPVKLSKKEQAASVAEYWVASARRKLNKGDFITASKHHRMAAKYYRLAGEEDLASINERAADRLAAPPLEPKLPRAIQRQKRRGRKKSADGFRIRGRAQSIKIYDFLCTYKAAHDGIAPSLREIADACQITSTSVVNYYLHGLTRNGLIVYGSGEARNIQVTNGEWRLLKRPLFHELWSSDETV